MYKNGLFVDIEEFVHSVLNLIGIKYRLRIEVSESPCKECEIDEEPPYNMTINITEYDWEGFAINHALYPILHELGHFVRFKLKLQRDKEFRSIFGNVKLKYDEDNITDLPKRPKKPSFVSPYAEKHPDEDWAETFAYTVGGILELWPLKRPTDKRLAEKINFIKSFINNRRNLSLNQ